MKHRWPIVAVVVALGLLLFASCSLTTNRSTDRALRGRMLLWHALSRSESDALNQVINSFNDLNPNVTVKVQVFSTTVELNEQFISAADTGLGPDLILASSTQLAPLQTAGYLSPIDRYLSENFVARFNPGLFSMLQVDGQTYGLPLSLDTLGIYVNRQLVEAPSTTLSGLLEQASAGITVLMPTNFVDAFWGIQAFGGRLFNEEGEAILDQGGFANWLAWLRDARNAPGMIQDTNRDLLRQRFMAGEAGYYLGYASELNEITTALGEGNVTVLPQPSGPVGAAGPLVRSQTFFFSSNSSSNQRRLAAELASFVTNSEQSSRLMRLVRFVPANNNVRINPRLFPTVAAFASQARNGIPYPTSPDFDTIVRLGNEAYVRTLEGGEPPVEVAIAVNNIINEARGLEVEAQPTVTCSGLGTIRLVHSWEQEDDQAALEGLTADFRQMCPHIIIETEAMSDEQLPRHLDDVGASGLRPTSAIVTQEQLAQLLAPEPQVQNLGGLVTSDTLQRFTPIAVEAMRNQGGLYALPVALHVNALYFNRQLVPTPAQTVDELRAQSMAGVPITLDTRFENAFWGIRAFGGQLFAENGAALLDQGGMDEWLLWLRESRDNYGIRLSKDGDEILRRFLAGESAYYVGGASELESLREALDDRLGIALLPSGPTGPAQPLVRAEGFVLRTGVTESAQNLALEFMRFATDVQSQTRLMNEAGIIPANANVSPNGGTTNDSFLAVFIEQAQTGYLLPNTPYWQPVVELGAEAYADVLENGLDPKSVVSELVAAINRANGIVVTPTPTPASPPPDVLRDEALGDEALNDEATPAPDEDEAGADESDESQEGNREAAP